MDSKTCQGCGEERDPSKTCPNPECRRLSEEAVNAVEGNVSEARVQELEKEAEQGAQVRKAAYEMCDAYLYACRAGNTDAMGSFISSIPRYMEIIDMSRQQAVSPEEAQPTPYNVMLYVSGRKGSYHCECGCNVFTRFDVGLYRCNSCEAQFRGEGAR